MPPGALAHRHSHFTFRKEPLLRRALFVFVCAILLVISSPAQNSRGSLRGTVQDVTGARVPSAKIVLHAQDSSLQREAASEDRGEFRIDDLLPGSYQVTVSAEGFAQAQAQVSIAVSSVRDVTVTLKPLAAPETINVPGKTSSIKMQPID